MRMATGILATKEPYVGSHHIQESFPAHTSLTLGTGVSLYSSSALVLVTASVLYFKLAVIIFYSVPDIAMCF